MLIFVEPDKTLSQHSVINNAMIDVYKHVFNLDKATIICSSSLYQEVNKSLLQLNHIGIKVIGQYGICKYIMDFFNSFRIVYMLLRLKPSIIVFLSLHPFMHLWFRLFAYMMSAEVHVICHGEIKFFNCKNNKFISPRKIMEFAFKISSEKLKNKWKYVFLGGNIKTPRAMLHCNIIRIDHPHIFSRLRNAKNNYANRNDNKVVVGLIGIASRSKGSERFFELAKKLSKQEKFIFKVTGMIDSSMSEYIDSGVEGDFSGKFLTREKVAENLDSLDIAVFVYDENYTDVASGAIIDAIDYEIPCLVLKNSYIKYLENNDVVFFEKFDDLDQIFHYLLNLNGESLPVFDFSKAREFFSISKACNQIATSYKGKFYG